MHTPQSSQTNSLNKCIRTTDVFVCFFHLKADDPCHSSLICVSTVDCPSTRDVHIIRKMEPNHPRHRKRKKEKIERKKEQEQDPIFLIFSLPLPAMPHKNIISMSVPQRSSSGHSSASPRGQSCADGTCYSQPSRTPCPWCPFPGPRGWGSRGSWRGQIDTSPRDHRLFLMLVPLENVIQ